MPKKAKVVGKKVRRSASGRPGNITMQQYELAWDMYVLNHKVWEICAATGLTEAQLNWLRFRGDEQMTSLERRRTELSVKLRGEQVAVTTQLGTVLSKWVEGASGANDAIAIRNQILRYWGQQTLQAMKRISEGTSTAEDKALVAIGYPKDVRDTLLMLERISQGMSVTKDVVVDFFKPPEVDMLNLPPALMKGLPAETQVPAALAPPPVAVAAGDDPILAALPGWAEWTDEERAYFARTGDLPERLFEPLALPPADTEDTEEDTEDDDG